MNFNSTKNHKRITVKPSGCPNPLFEQWLEEWRKEAADRDSDLQFCFKRALQSLRRYPLKLNTGKECLVLKNVGSHLAVRLDRKLAEYRRTHPEEAMQNESSCSSPTHVTGQSLARKISKIPEEIIKPSKRKMILQSKAVLRETSATLARSSKSDEVYVPAVRSGSYAILITILKGQDDVPNREFMKKAEIIDKAENLCDSSFTRPNPGSRYTAWSSMSTLIKKGLVVKHGNPAKYTLTEEGRELALKLYVSLLSQNESTSHSDCTTPLTSPNKISSIPWSSYPSPITYSSCSTQMDDDNHLPDQQDDDICKTYDMPYTLPLASEQSSQNDNQNPSTDLNSHEQLIFSPGKFKIFLLVDVMETTGNRRNQITQETIRELTNLKTSFEIRSLKVGDFTWIARDNNNRELVLPYIVERKRMDDLGKSIKDGRFHEQKFRLRLCGLQNVVYLVEKFGNDTHVGLPVNSLHQAIINSQVVDNFFIKTTNSHKQSMFYLSALTNLLTNMFKDKTLISCPRSELSDFDYKAEIISLLTFQEFSKLSMKNKNLKIRDMFMKHLLQLKGCSVEKASAIVNQYSTPRLLKEAFDSSSKPETLLANLTSGAQNRNIGPTLSQAIYQLYTSRVLS